MQSERTILAAGARSNRERTMRGRRRPDAQRCHDGRMSNCNSPGPSGVGRRTLSKNNDVQMSRRHSQRQLQSRTFWLHSMAGPAVTALQDRFNLYTSTSCSVTEAVTEGVTPVTQQSPTLSHHPGCHLRRERLARCLRGQRMSRKFVAATDIASASLLCLGPVGLGTGTRIALSDATAITVLLVPYYRTL